MLTKDKSRTVVCSGAKLDNTVANSTWEYRSDKALCKVHKIIIFKAKYYCYRIDSIFLLNMQDQYALSMNQSLFEQLLIQLTIQDDICVLRSAAA